MNNTKKYANQFGPTDFSVSAEKAEVEIALLQKLESASLLFITFDLVGEVANIKQARSTFITEAKRLDSRCWV